MHRIGVAAIVLPLLGACTGGASWTGFGFRADGPEMPRIRQELTLKPGQVVADVGAGKGELTLALAREVGPNGRVFSTEIEPERRRALREAATAAALGNVTVVDASSDDASLPPNCCDLILLRRVYHHLTDPARTNASLLRSLKPGGVLAVIDFPPPFFASRGDLGVAANDVIAEMTSSGFKLHRLIDNWPGRGPLGSYCAVFHKPG